MFVEKALRLQMAGAVGMLVVNSAGVDLLPMGTDTQGTQTAIPAVMLSAADGGALLGALHGGATPRVRLHAPASGGGEHRRRRGRRAGATAARRRSCGSKWSC